MRYVSDHAKYNRSMSRFVVLMWTILLLPGALYYGYHSSGAERFLWISAAMAVIWIFAKWWKAHPEL